MVQELNRFPAGKIVKKANEDLFKPPAKRNTLDLPRSRLVRAARRLRKPRPKAAAFKLGEEKVGDKLQMRTMTTVINTDTKTADL